MIGVSLIKKAIENVWFKVGGLLFPNCITWTIILAMYSSVS
jgi:hypothetical protein